MSWLRDSTGPLLSLLPDIQPKLPRDVSCNGIFCCASFWCALHPPSSFKEFQVKFTSRLVTAACASLSCLASQTDSCAVCCPSLLCCTATSPRLVTAACLLLSCQCAPGLSPTRSSWSHCSRGRRKTRKRKRGQQQHARKRPQQEMRREVSQHVCICERKSKLLKRQQTRRGWGDGL